LFGFVRDGSANLGAEMKEVKIEEITTFIKLTREEAITLAYEIGGGEVHALHIQRGFGAPAEKPVGYLVLPLKRGKRNEHV
jgi:hypothetical protein